MQVVLCILLCPFLADGTGFMPLGLPSQVQLKFSSQNAREIRVDMSGKVAMTYFPLHGSVTYASEMAGKIAGGNHTVTFLGWNNLVTKKVNRYLIVDTACWQSEETIKILDPFTAVMDKYHAAGPGREQGTELHKFSEGSVTAEMVTGISGKPERAAKLQVGDASFNAIYTEYSTTVDGCSKPLDSCKLFYKYKDFSCKMVSPSSLASMPHMQITDWLVLEYPSLPTVLSLIV